jgi:FdhD protein
MVSPQTMEAPVNSVTIDPPVHAIRSFEAHRVTAAGVELRREPIAVETPVALLFNGQSFAVMLATPSDLDDFARGFAVTEDVIGSADEVRAIDIVEVSRGIEVRVTIPEDRAAALAARRRSLAGRSGCGLCGVDRFSDALRPIAAVAAKTRFAPEALHRVIGAMAEQQILNAEVGSIHAAAFADADGRILHLREDIGRHNALDKLIGSLFAGRIDPASGFVMVSSRCSYEMVHKTAAAGIGLIAAVSAPTSLAIELAAKVGVGLVGFAREGRFTVYANPEKITDAAGA